ncbi:hypothetical protein MPSEU_000646000 [Mayamaea pseudoterrestris]|nr:hypothetical protein MPSEU_000646000 [Mayamaea pseudoterrestris]
MVSVIDARTTSIDSSPRSTVSIETSVKNSTKPEALDAMNGSSANSVEEKVVTATDVTSDKNHEKQQPSTEEPATPRKDPSPAVELKHDRLSPSPAAVPISGYPYMTGYYVGGHQSQATEPPSPGISMSAVYDTGSFFQSSSGPFHSSAFATGSNTPLSPPRPTNMVGVIPPASPLFPRVPMIDGSGQQQHPPSPNLPYMSTTLPSIYQHYGVNLSSGSSNSLDEAVAWNESRSQQQNGYQQSPQIQGMQMSYGIALSRAAMGARAYSFDESMLPPSVLDAQDLQGNPAYSPYSTSQASPIPGTGGTLFAQQPGWGYAGGLPSPDMYSTQGHGLQPRPSAATMGLYSGGAQVMTQAGMRTAAASGAVPGYGGQFYPATSPGPPIQTTASNKGPDGANLFIFHIPNHFTNLDMYQLFCAYGNLLSVRIMVEKETGRSRGFGFVSYDSPEAAALAIKELNGYAVGNKRLKVQHKQIRPKDLHSDRDEDERGFGMPPIGGNFSQFSSSSLPPSGPMANQLLWYGARKPQDGNILKEGNPDDGSNLTNNAGADNSLQYGPVESGGLANMGSLQNALPDVAGNGSVPE